RNDNSQLSKLRIKQTHKRAKRAEKLRLVTLDQEIEGSNPSSPAISSAAKVNARSARPARTWQDAVCPPWVLVRILLGCQSPRRPVFCGFVLHDATRLRTELKAARTSSEKSCGCSQAAKWPPLSTSWK